jgi:class 3 adenylate cyclase
MDKHVNSEVLTLLLVDLCSYTKLSRGLGREGLHNLHEVFDNLSLPVFESYGGKVIKKAGDSFWVSFNSATTALHCAIELRKKFVEYNREYRPSRPVMIRGAIHTGEVIHRKGDIYGNAVNIVYRLEAVTPAGQIFFTRPSFQMMNKNEIPFQYMGAKKFQGVRGVVKIFRVRNLEQERRKQINQNMNLFWKIFFWLVVFGLAYFVLKRFF